MGRSLQVELTVEMIPAAENMIKTILLLIAVVGGTTQYGHLETAFFMLETSHAHAAVLVV